MRRQQRLAEEAAAQRAQAAFRARSPSKATGILVSLKSRKPKRLQIAYV